MRVLSAAEMREVDRLTIEAGIPGIILMESAARAVVEFLQEHCTPLEEQHVTVVCGKGNNGGDGFAIARQLHTAKLCGELTVIELFDPSELSGDAAATRRMLDACGCPVKRGLEQTTQTATVLVDAVLGTGLQGPARGPALDAIRSMNTYFPSAITVAVDIPSGLPSEPEASSEPGEYVEAQHTVTFTAPKPAQVLAPDYEKVGQLAVAPIGTPDTLIDRIPGPALHLTTESDIAPLFGARPADSNKGMYGHVLVVGGSFGKSGAPAMTGTAAYRTGAGLVTVAIPKSALTMVASYRPELMTEPLPESENGRLRFEEVETILKMLEKMTVLAIGPGMGTDDTTVQLVRKLYEQARVPAVVDADALNAIAGHLPHTDKVRILTPHPGEMSRLTGKPTKEVQADRLGAARKLASESGAAVVLKGDRTVIAFPDGETWINSTGSPAMATGGTGDILTGMVAGAVAQHPKDWKRAVVAAVWLHGRCGSLAGEEQGEEFTLATDLLDYLPEAMDEIRPPV
jgi:ADP-dependent NAD(P)H-hydrate dehydratase / NAD(P)H-hydrate epimerase